MKNTGVTRRIDELGRVVIPKEIRKNLGIREGESLEIFTDEERIILQKQMVIEKASSLASLLVSIVSNIYNIDVFISDRERIMISNDNLTKGFLPTHMINLMDKRENYLSSSEEEIQISDISVKGYFFLSPIIIDTDVVGLIIVKKTTKIEQEEINVTKIIKEIITKELSIS